MENKRAHNLKTKLQSIRKRLAGVTKRHPIGPLVAVLLSGIIIVSVLFLPPYVGMEDNGDYARIIYGEGLYDLPENSELLYNGYFIKEYGIAQYYNEYSNSVFTSQFIFIQPAIWLNKLFTGNSNIFDLRFLGLVMTIYFLVVLYFLVDYLTHKLRLGSVLLITAVCTFIFADTGYTAYFSSFFAESIAYISLMAAITCALLIAEGRRNKYFLLAWFLVNGAILTFSKQQYAPVGVILGILCLFFFIRAHGRLYKSLIALSSAVLIVMGIFTYSLISVEFTNINLFHSMTRGVMMTSDNPPQTLETFGIDDKYELLNKNIYFDKYPVIDPEDQKLKEEFYSKYNVLSVVGHYVSNPDAFMEMMKTAAKNAYRIRPDLGNFEHSSGLPPETKCESFSNYSHIKEISAPKTFGFIIIWTFVALALLYKKRLKQITIGALIIIGLSQIIVPVIGAGDADLAKHMFLYNVAFDLVNVIMISHIVAFFDRRYQTSKCKASEIVADVEGESCKRLERGAL